MKTKNYKITFSLSSGYSGTGETFTPEFAEGIIEEWMAERIKNNLPTLNGFLTFGKLFFSAKGRREDGKPVTMVDSGVYEGNLSSKNDIKRNNSEIRDSLISLATNLKDQLGQDRVYIIYENECWFV